MLRILGLILLCFSLAAPVFAAPPCPPQRGDTLDVQTLPAPRSPGKDDKCPVCGMFVHKYPDWLGQVIYADGEVAYFDGAKDMFKYLFGMDTYAPARAEGDITGVYVTEYYEMEPISAKMAWYVLGSDVYGPMGRELIPLATCEDAQAFADDHKGTRIVTWTDITPALIKTLD